MKFVYAIIIVLITGVILGLLLALADKFLKVKEDPRKNDINNLLPGANCGVCGYPGCAGLAQAFIDGKVTKANECKVIKEAKMLELQKYLDEMRKNKE